MTNEQNLKVAIQQARAAVAEAQEDDGIVTIAAEMLALLLEALAPGDTHGVDLLRQARAALADIANSADMTLEIARKKAARIYRETTPSDDITAKLELAPGGSKTPPNTAVPESGTGTAPSVDAEFLSLVGHCSNCGCADCREFFRGQPEPKSWTAGDGACDCAVLVGKLWHSANCSSLTPPIEPKREHPSTDPATAYTAAVSQAPTGCGCLFGAAGEHYPSCAFHPDHPNAQGSLQNRTEKP